jgi:hypothetical protein
VEVELDEKKINDNLKTKKCEIEVIKVIVSD